MIAVAATTAAIAATTVSTSRIGAEATATMSHWHKLGFQAFLAKEIMRKDTLPFAIGMGFVALMGLGLNASITEEDRKSSAYHKQFVLNDRKGDH